jgi:hypothetical protein
METGQVMNPIALIAEGRFAEAGPIVALALSKIAEQKLTVLRRVMGEVMFGKAPVGLAEANRMRQGRTILIRRRIRKGKLQRNVRKSAVKGFTVRNGKISRIPVARRIHMRITQRKAARRRKSHMQSTIRKRKLSMRKRKSYGIK